LLLGPPLALASKLPTVCNIFHNKPIEKAGSCGHRTMFSKIQDKSFEVEAGHFFSTELGTSHFTAVSNSFPIRFSEIADLPQSSPLRC
jgi:hypothetical protein